MAKITNDNIGTPGTATNAATANAKFTDITTATTTSLSNLNVRAQGVDTPNIASTGLIQDFQFYNNSLIPVGGGLPWALVSNGTAAVPIIDPGVPANIAQISYAGGLTLEAGDILRIQFTVELERHNAATVTTPYPDTQASPMAIAFVLWDITDNTLANFEPLPGRASLEAAVAAGNSIIIDNHNGAQTNYMTDGCAIFSYNCCPITGAPTHGHVHQVSPGMLVYQRPIPSPNLTVYGIRLFLRGQMIYEQSGAAGHRVFTVGAGGNITHDINYVSLMSMHMRHGATP